MKRIAWLVAAFVIGCTAADWGEILEPPSRSPEGDLGSGYSGRPSSDPDGFGSQYGDRPTGAAPYFRESQPRMTSALEHLREAKNELHQADTNKGGYRKDAIDRVEAAIEAVENGMRYDDRH